MIKKRNTVIVIVVSILIGFLIPIAFGAYHGAVSPGESMHLFYSFPSEKARPIVFHYGAGGIGKIIDPNTLEVTIGLTNTGKSRMIGFRLENLSQNVHVHWSGFYTKGFNEEKMVIDRVVEHGSSVSVHLTFFIEEAEDKPVIYDGHFEVYDLDTGDALLKIPVNILNVKVG